MGMSLREIEEKLSGNTLSYNKISMSALANIMKFVNVELEMDEKSLDYYYVIDIDKLSKSQMPKDELGTLKSQGWSFSDDKKFLILFLKNN